jgi:hypothetical protein
VNYPKFSVQDENRSRGLFIFVSNLTSQDSGHHGMRSDKVAWAVIAGYYNIFIWTERGSPPKLGWSARGAVTL